MKFLSNILLYFKNKYFLAFAAFVVWMLFFDKNDVLIQADRNRQLSDLQNSKKFYEGEIEKTKKELGDLQNSSLALEKYARENFYMKRANEDVFVIKNAKDSLKK